MNPNTAEQINLINKIIELSYQLIEKLMQQKENLLDEWCDAIQEFEGYYPGSKSFRNKNPGNLRYIKQAGSIGQDTTGFAIFRTYHDGRKALYMMLKRAATGLSKVYRPDMSLASFFHTYAPTSDNNAPDTYAKFVAKKLGVSVTTKIKDLA
jgi:hypothetical protein